MIKTFLISLILQQFLFSQQIILVVSQNFQTKNAILSLYEDNQLKMTPFEVNLGKKGLGWGIGEIELTKQLNEPTKQEGDKKAPAGIFKLSSAFGYDESKDTKLEYQHLSKELICVDDSDSKLYNKIVPMPIKVPKSFETMRRDDHQYELGIVVAHNKEQKKMAGSCIFLHVEKFKGAGTAGCTSMSLENLQIITNWIDESKNPILIQIPQRSLSEIKKLYPTLPL